MIATLVKSIFFFWQIKFEYQPSNIYTNTFWDSRWKIAFGSALVCLHSHYETLFYVHSPFQTEILSSEKTKHTADINNRILSVLIKSWAYGPAVRFVSLCASPHPIFHKLRDPMSTSEGRAWVSKRVINRSMSANVMTWGSAQNLPCRARRYQSTVTLTCWYSWEHLQGSQS